MWGYTMGSGTNRERQLAAMVDGEGLSVMRSPSSGGGTKREQPDLAIFGVDAVYLLEQKYDAGRIVYITEEEVQSLYTFRSNAAYPMEVVLCARFKGDTSFYFSTPDRLTRTDAGSYRLLREDRGEYVTATEWLTPQFPRLEWSRGNY